MRTYDVLSLPRFSYAIADHANSGHRGRRLRRHRLGKTILHTYTYLPNPMYQRTSTFRNRTRACANLS